MEQIVPVTYPPSLLFYSSIDHTAELYSYASSGQIQRLWKETGWLSSWEQIVSFPYTSNLLPYSSSEHTGRVIRVSQDGSYEVKNHTNFGTNLQIVSIRVPFPIILLLPRSLSFLRISLKNSSPDMRTKSGHA